MLDKFIDERTALEKEEMNATHVIIFLFNLLVEITPSALVVPPLPPLGTRLATANRRSLFHGSGVA